MDVLFGGDLSKIQTSTFEIKILSCSVLAWLGLAPVWPWSGLGLVLVLVWLWSGPGLALVWPWSGPGLALGLERACERKSGLILGCVTRNRDFCSFVPPDWSWMDSAIEVGDSFCVIEIVIAFVIQTFDQVNITIASTSQVGPLRLCMYMLRKH